MTFLISARNNSELHKGRIDTSYDFWLMGLKIPITPTCLRSINLHDQCVSPTTTAVRIRENAVDENFACPRIDRIDSILPVNQIWDWVICFSLQLTRGVLFICLCCQRGTVCLSIVLRNTLLLAMWCDLLHTDCHKWHFPPGDDRSCDIISSGHMNCYFRVLWGLKLMILLSCLFYFQHPSRFYIWGILYLRETCSPVSFYHQFARGVGQWID